MEQKAEETDYHLPRRSDAEAIKAGLPIKLSHYRRAESLDTTFPACYDVSQSPPSFAGSHSIWGPSQNARICSQVLYNGHLREFGL